MVSLPTLAEMLKSGVHFGHKRSRRHPKMDAYIFTTRNDVAIIDLEKTVQKLHEALSFLTDTARKGGTILLIGTKKQAGTLVAKAAESCGMPYVSNHWIGGTITNFAVISRMIKKFKKMKEKIESGELVTKYTKKEQLDFTREHDELRTMLGGIQDLIKVPDAIFIIDMKHECTALREAIRKNVPIVALCDANANPELVEYPIPCNDDAVKSIEMMTRLASEAINEGKALREKDIASNQNAAPARSMREERVEDASSALTL